MRGARARVVMVAAGLPRSLPVTTLQASQPRYIPAVGRAQARVCRPHRLSIVPPTRRGYKRTSPASDALISHPAHPAPPLGQRSRLHARARPPRSPTPPEHENQPAPGSAPATGRPGEGHPSQLPGRTTQPASRAVQLLRHIPVGRGSNSRACLSRPTAMSENINSRPAAPVRSYTPGPPDASNDFLKEQINKQQRSNFHSTSLNKSISMVANPVNRTALHPGGVE